jgi:hypothetical protein
VGLIKGMDWRDGQVGWRDRHGSIKGIDGGMDRYKDGGMD